MQMKPSEWVFGMGLFTDSNRVKSGLFSCRLLCDTLLCRSSNHVLEREGSAKPGILVKPLIYGSISITTLTAQAVLVHGFAAKGYLYLERQSITTADMSFQFFWF